MKVEFFRGSILIRPETPFETEFLRNVPQAMAEVIHNFNVSTHAFVGIQIQPVLGQSAPLKTLEKPA